MRASIPWGMASVLVMLGCSDAPTSPDRPSLELTDPTQRWDAAGVNSHIYGSFRIDLPISTCYAVVQNSAQPTNTEPCNFYRGGQKEEAGGTLQFELLGFSEVGDGVSLSGASFIFSNGDAPRGNTFGGGVVSGYAIDASTLGTTNRRVGTLTFDLAQFTSAGTDYIYFGGSDGCVLDASISASCLNLIISTDYAPLPAPSGVGSAQAVPGFLWMSPATAPYNYLP
jgi:hypothetical protein